MDALHPPGAGVSPDELEEIEEIVQDELPAYLEDLATLVNVDCGSYTKVGVDQVGAWTAAFLERLGAEVEIHVHSTLGNTIVGTFRGRAGGPRVLLIGHLDTVFSEGTAGARPFRIEAGLAHGPGVTDMKSGLLAGLYAVLALTSLGEAEDATVGEVGPARSVGSESAELPFERLVFVANPDEEIGSISSSPIIRELALASDVALVLECARANGDIVSARKGTVDLRLTVHGRAAHAGVEPEKGRNAILAAAQLIVELQALNGRWPGVTLNVGVIHGGSRPNVVAEEAVLEVDLRAFGRADLEAAEAAVRTAAARTTVPDTHVTVEETARHWPMEKLERSGRLVEHAQAIAGRLGFELADASTGGASDANTTAGLGVPSLDGLGPIGGNDHSPAEYLDVESIVPRTVLLAGLLLAIGRDPVIGSWRPHRA
ncbi:MAG: M20 family metallopeptidase [Candidatus Limnocylindrales bacterium]